MSISRDYVLQQLRAALPPRFAVEGDRTGLQLGSAEGQVERVLCTLDLTLTVAEEARDWGAGLIVSHHALIYRPLQQLRTDLGRGRIFELLLKNDIAVYVPHTALDVIAGGLNDRLAECVGLQETVFLKESGRDECVLHRYRVAPEEQERLERLYRDCELLARDHNLLEVLVPARRSARLMARAQRELGQGGVVVALQEPSERRGLGRIGRLPVTQSVGDLARSLKERLSLPGVRFAAAHEEAPVSKVAVACGDGRSLIDSAIFAGAAALVTGDIDHHTALDAVARGIALIDVGHWGSEQFAPELLASLLRDRLSDKAVEVLASRRSTQPFAFVP